MKPERFLAIVSLIPYGIHKLKSIIPVWPVLLATLLLALPAAGPAESIPAAADGMSPQQEQTTLTDLPLPAQFSISAAIGRDQTGYHLVPTANGFRANQPNQGLTADFSPAGLDLRAGADHWTLGLTAYGYGAHLAPVEPTRPQAEANRLEYRRGPLTEWYQYGPLGLQQGFTLAKRPASSGLDKATESPLTLALRLTGPAPRSLGPCARCARPGGANSPSQRGQAASVSEDGRSLKMGSLNYTGLLAYDAAGRELPAWLELHGDRLLLRVDDRNAAYPLFIDPWLQQAKLTAYDSVEIDEFGKAVAVSGDTIVVGANGDDDDRGSAYVFIKPSEGWATTNTYTAKLIASDGAAGDQFGATVAVNGDAVVVGARYDDDRGIDSGSTYVFIKPSGGWVTTSTYTAKLTASDGATGDWFGQAVAISGDTAIVGAPFNDSRGSAYVFIKPSGGWATTNTYTAKLTASDGATGDRFGYDVAASGDTFVVGADGDESYFGSTYVFIKPSGGWATTSTYTAKLTASDGAENDQFGFTVAISGDTIIVGAPYDDGQVANSGSAYVFIKPSGGWATTSTYTAKLTASDGMTGDGFGDAVAAISNAIIVGTDGDDDRGIDSGSVYTFIKPSEGWATTSTYTAKLTASDGAENNQFGRALAVSGNTVVVGACRNEDHTGSAYVFTLLSPKMAAQGKGLEIAAGDTTPSPTDDTDFGSVKVSGETVVHTFTINNTGVANLNLTQTPPVTITGPAASDFSVTSPPSSTVSISGSTTFQVRFDPTAAGVRLATVSIANDDPDKNPYDFAIQGVGIAHLYLPIVVKPFPVGALSFRNDSGSSVTVTLFGYETRIFGAGQQTWNGIPVGTYDWTATGTCNGQSGTIGSKQTGANYRAPIVIEADKTTTLNAERGGRFSCG